MASLNNMNTLNAKEFIVNATSISDLYATLNYVSTNSGGISQQDVDDSLALLISKDIAYNNTLDTNTTDVATHTNDIAVLNTKQIQNFAGINNINTNFQTILNGSQLATTFYNNTEFDTTLGN